MFRKDILQHWIESPQNLLMTNHQMCLRAQRVEDTGQFDGDVSGANDSNPLWLLFDVEETVRVDTIRRSGDLFVLGDSRPASDSDDELLGTDCVFRAIWSLDLHLVLVEERGISFVVGDVVLDQILLAEGETSLTSIWL